MAPHGPRYRQQEEEPLFTCFADRVVCGDDLRDSDLMPGHGRCQMRHLLADHMMAGLRETLLNVVHEAWIVLDEHLHRRLRDVTGMRLEIFGVFILHDFDDRICQRGFELVTIAGLGSHKVITRPKVDEVVRVRVMAGLLTTPSRHCIVLRAL
jgi:hypothetical protein